MLSKTKMRGVSIMRKLFGAARASVVLAMAFGLATVANAADACTENMGHEGK